MTQVELGRSSLAAGRLGYGCWRWGRTANEMGAQVRVAIDEGLTLVDTADVYGLISGGEVGHAETLLGRLFASSPGLREEIVVATKGGIRPGIPYDSGKAHLVAACEASLRRLGVDVIDLYQVHRLDYLAHPHDVADALATLRRAGKVRDVGVSNYTAAQTRALMRYLDCPLATVQPKLSLLALDALDDGVLDLCMEHRITPLAWSPLAGGALADAMQENGELAQQLDHLATIYETNRAAIALAFLIAHPAGIIPLVGSTNPRHIRACAQALRFELSKADWYALLAATGRTLL